MTEPCGCDSLNGLGWRYLLAYLTFCSQYPFPLALTSKCFYIRNNFFFQWPSIWVHLAHEGSCIPVQFCNVTSCLCWTI
jgi:hypothetical protein